MIEKKCFKKSDRKSDSKKWFKFQASNLNARSFTPLGPRPGPISLVALYSPRWPIHILTLLPDQEVHSWQIAASVLVFTVSASRGFSIIDDRAARNFSVAWIWCSSSVVVGEEARSTSACSCFFRRWCVARRIPLRRFSPPPPDV